MIINYLINDLIWLSNLSNSYSDFLTYYGIDKSPNEFEFVNGDLNFTENAKKVLEEFIHTSPKSYEESFEYFQNNCESMADYLNYYNMLDVDILMASIDLYSQGFFDQWGINVHHSLSLPGIAEKLAYKNYPDNCAPIYSFGDQFKKYSTEIRR